MMSRPFVDKLLTGKVKQVGDPNAKNLMDKQWESSIFKETVSDPVWLSKTGLVGDEVADTENHGGQEKAIFAYSIAHYDLWEKELGLPNIEVGLMGENLAVAQM